MARRPRTNASSSPPFSRPVRRGGDHCPMNHSPPFPMRRGDNMLQGVAAATTSKPEYCRRRVGLLRGTRKRAWLALALLGLLAARPANADIQTKSAAGTCVDDTGIGT